MIKNGEFVIPDVINGITSSDEWEQKRAEILNEFAELEYGKRPDMDYTVSWTESLSEDVDEINAVHKKIQLTVTTNLGEYTFPVTVFLPKCDRKVPATVLICSQSAHPTPQQMPKELAGMNMEELQQKAAQLFVSLGIKMDHPEALLAGAGPAIPLDLDKDYDNGHWPVREMMKNGMGMVGFYAQDAEIDNAEAYPSGLARIFGTQAQRADDGWGVLAVWAFAASCVMDYVTKALPEVDSSKVAVTGHSRCGKAALWCGANDERFAAVMPNGSGCCGAALSRNKTGENLKSIQAFFPHWFAPNFRQFAGNEGALPYDQHFLLAAVAPRLLQVGSGSEDDWADPEGEHYSTVLASQVWTLYGQKETLLEEMPEADSMQMVGKVGYHLRKGPHKLDVYDWSCLANHMKEAL